MSESGFYDPNSYGQQPPQGYDMSFQQDGFAQFDYNSAAAADQHQQFDQPPADSYGQQPTSAFYDQQQGYSGNIFTPDQHAYTQPMQNGDEDDFENEPPLLEELGINFDHIYQKTLAVLNPLKEAEQAVVQDSDLAGPLVFCLAFGATLLLAGKIQFGYIYGLGVVGSLGMYSLLNLMSLTGVSVTCVISVLGYCLLPMVILSAIGIITSLTGIIATVLSSMIVLWCSFSASKLFVSALQMDGQQFLIAYPCALVYAVFALLTIF